MNTGKDIFVGEAKNKNVRTSTQLDRPNTMTVISLAILYRLYQIHRCDWLPAIQVAKVTCIITHCQSVSQRQFKLCSCRELWSFQGTRRMWYIDFQTTRTSPDLIKGKGFF